MGNFQPCPPIRRAGEWSLWKPSNNEIQRVSGLVNTQKCWKVGHGSPLPSLIPYLCISSTWLFLNYIFYNQHKKSWFQSLVSHSGQLSNLRRTFWQTPHFPLIGQKSWWHWTCNRHLKLWCHLMRLSPKTVKSMLTLGMSIRMECDLLTSSWCLENQRMDC